jgi:hypothetical protein
MSDIAQTHLGQRCKLGFIAEVELMTQHSTESANTAEPRYKKTDSQHMSDLVQELNLAVEEEKKVWASRGSE